MLTLSNSRRQVRKLDVLNTGCLPFVTYDSSLPLQCLHLVAYCCSVLNLYKLFRQRENHSSLKRGLFKQLDILHTKKCAHIPTILAIFFRLYPLLIWVGTIITFVLFSQKKKPDFKKIKCFRIVGGSKKDAVG